MYTLAGKAIEPKQADYMERAYFMTLVRPADVYGEDYFHKTYGDFFKEQRVFGGMWDYLETEDSKVVSVLEMKTSKRTEDWKDDIPEYYAMQAALYAWLLKVDTVYMVASFLEDKDYKAPEKFTPNAGNTIVREFSLKKRYPDFAGLIAKAERFWTEHVMTGVSPAYDEEKDADILKELRKNAPETDEDLTEAIREAEALKAEIDAESAKLKDKEKRLKTIQESIRDFGIDRFREGDKTVEIAGERYVWTITKGQTEKVNKDALKQDGIYDKYVTLEDSYRLTAKERKDK